MRSLRPLKGGTQMLFLPVPFPWRWLTRPVPVRLPGDKPAAGEHADPGDPGVPGERAGGEGPEEALQPGAEEPAAGRVPEGESVCMCARLCGGDQR